MGCVYVHVLFLLCFVVITADLAKGSTFIIVC